MCGGSAERAASHSLRAMSSSFQPDQAIIYDGLESSSSSSSPSASSSPRPPLPDPVLRSFQFPDQQRTCEIDDNPITTHPRSAGNNVRDSRSVQTDDRGAATTATGETRQQEKDSMDWSRLSNNDLDLIIANLEAHASERRNKIRKIEALSEELGLSIRQQNWAALLNRPSLEPNRCIVVRKIRGDHEQVQAQPDAPRNVEPVHISETGSTHDSVFMDDNSANTPSNVQTEPEAPLQSQRLLRGLARPHDQLQRCADQHEDGEDEEIPAVNHPRSPVQIQAIPSEYDLNAASRQRNSSLVFTDGVAKRTAWSIVLETHPNEIATRFRAGERPTNKQVSSMVGMSTSH